MWENSQINFVGNCKQVKYLQRGRTILCPGNLQQGSEVDMKTGVLAFLLALLTADMIPEDAPSLVIAALQCMAQQMPVIEAQ